MSYALAIVPPRVLIMTASVGEGHDAPARTLADQLRGECPGVEIFVEDGLAVMGRVIRGLSLSAPRVVFFRGEWLWDLGYDAFASLTPTRRLSQAALGRFGAPGLRGLVEAVRPDIVVSLFPQTTEVLGRLRAAGRLDVPVVAAITDISALWYWATPGADVHLVTHPESIAEVRRIAGTGAEVHCVRGFTRPEFLERRSAAEARAALVLPPSGNIVLVSGGGWGVGRITEAVDVALRRDDVSLVVCLCGRNEALRQTMVNRYATQARVRVEGFTEEMPGWLAAADTLIHSTGGLTMLEAQMRECPAISFGWGRGHVRLHNEAFRRFGLAQVAESDEELERALTHSLVARPSIPFDFASLPSAASLVLAQVGWSEERGTVDKVVATHG